MDNAWMDRQTDTWGGCPEERQQSRGWAGLSGRPHWGQACWHTYTYGCLNKRLGGFSVTWWRGDGPNPPMKSTERNQDPDETKPKQWRRQPHGEHSQPPTLVRDGRDESERKGTWEGGSTQGGSDLVTQVSGRWTVWQGWGWDSGMKCFNRRWHAQLGDVAWGPLSSELGGAPPAMPCPVHRCHSPGPGSCGDSLWVAEPQGWPCPRTF